MSAPLLLGRERAQFLVDARSLGAQGDEPDALLAQIFVVGAIVSDGAEGVQRIAQGGQPLLGALDLRHEARRRDDRVRGPFEQSDFRFEMRDVLLGGCVAAVGGFERLGQWRSARAWRARRRRAPR